MCARMQMQMQMRFNEPPNFSIYNQTVCVCVFMKVIK
jgi:hypothetical protein